MTPEKRHVGRPVEFPDVLDFLEKRLRKNPVFHEIKHHLDSARKEFGGQARYLHKNKL